MVLIYDDVNLKESYFIRDELLRRRIPCAVGTDKVLLSYALVLVFPIGDMAWQKVTSDKERVLWTDITAIGNNQRREGEILRLISRIEDVLFIKFGFDPYTVVRGAFYDSLDTCRYFGSECFLQDTERLIMRFLAVCGENRASNEVIRDYCLECETSASAVTVHISKINRRLYFYSSIKAVNSKRNFGYRLSFI